MIFLSFRNICTDRYNYRFFGFRSWRINLKLSTDLCSRRIKFNSQMWKRNELNSNSLRSFKHPNLWNGLTNDWNLQIEWKKRWRSGMFLVNFKRKPFQNVSIKGMREILPSHHFAARISCWLWCILHLKKNIEIKKCSYSRLNRYGPKKIRSISQYHKFAFFTLFFSYNRNRWKY